MKTIVAVFTAAALSTAAFSIPSSAQDNPSGGAKPAEVVLCLQRGADGKPVRKLSSEDICPQYQYWRDECARLVADPTVPLLFSMHCGTAAMRSTEDTPTGSIGRPARRTPR